MGLADLWPLHDPRQTRKSRHWSGMDSGGFFITILWEMRDRYSLILLQSGSASPQQDARSGDTPDTPSRTIHPGTARTDHPATSSLLDPSARDGRHIYFTIQPRFREVFNAASPVCRDLAICGRLVRERATAPPAYLFHRVTDRSKCIQSPVAQRGSRVFLQPPLSAPVEAVQLRIGPLEPNLSVV